MGQPAHGGFLDRITDTMWEAIRSLRLTSEHIAGNVARDLTAAGGIARVKTNDPHPEQRLAAPAGELSRRN